MTGPSQDAPEPGDLLINLSPRLEISAPGGPSDQGSEGGWIAGSPQNGMRSNEIQWDSWSPMNFPLRITKISIKLSKVFWLAANVIECQPFKFRQRAGCHETGLRPCRRLSWNIAFQLVILLPGGTWNPGISVCPLYPCNQATIHLKLSKSEAKIHQLVVGKHPN